MFGFIKKLLGVLVSIIKFPLTLLPGGKGKSAGAKVAKPETEATIAETETTSAKTSAFFLEEAEATGVTPQPTAKKESKKNKSKKSAKSKAADKSKATEPVAAAASTLNLPQPTVTTVIAEVTPTPANNYKQFASRRRPGANMKSYLDMAKTIKNA
jgi:hypothetical protein